MTIFRHRVNGSFGSQEVWTFGVYSEGAASIDVAEATWDAAVTAFFSPALSARMSTDVQALATSTASIDPGTGGQITRREVPNASAGTSVAESLPYQVTAVVSTRTGLATRAGRGRFYVPSLDVAQVLGGRISPACRTDLADGAQAMMQQLQTGGLVPVIFHRTASGGVAQFSTTQIETIDVGDVLDTQRRRRNKMVEDRISRPV